MKYFLLIFHNKIMKAKVLSLNVGIWITVNKKKTLFNLFTA